MLPSSWFRAVRYAVRGRPPGRNRRHRQPRLAPPLRVRLLEDRSLLSPYLVTTTADSGPGSLRDAITQVNADTNHTLYASPGNPNVDEIDFAVTAGAGYNPTTGVATITPLSNLPAITNAVFINGYTQSCASQNTLTQADNAVLKIDLDGSQAGVSAIGLDVNAPQCTVSGLDVTNWGGLGIWLDENSSGSTLAGNFVGTDVTGEVAMPNGSGPMALYNAFNAAIMVSSGNNEIGGTVPAARNLISGNNQALGINIQDTYDTYVNPPSIESGNQVQGNLIGTDAMGIQPLGNATAITVSPQPGPATVIGGTTAAARNVISASTGGTNPQAQAGSGIAVNGGGTTLIEGNYVGTDVTGSQPLPNYGFGVSIWNSTGTTLVGGTACGAGNVISGNLAGGVDLNGGSTNVTVQGNDIGTNAAGTALVPAPLVTRGVFVVGVQAISGTVIGGPAAGARNVISGNGVGIELSGTQSVVQGNFIGTDVTGTVQLGNQIGVEDTGGSGNTIGGTAAGARNIISGGGGSRVAVGGGGVGVHLNNASGDVVDGNYIGTDVTGALSLRNLEDGVLIDGGSGNAIGGTAAGAGNLIAFNGRDGVEVTSGAGNAILGNSIHDNSLLGIGLISANNANDKQAAPVLAGVSGSAASPAISGSLTSVANTTFRIELFANPTPGSLANTEGQTLLGAVYVTTNANGTATFTASGLAAIPAAQGNLTATATVATPVGSGYAYGDTSQFSSYLHVAYIFGGFQPPLSQGLNFALNRVIPIHFALTDLTGASVTSLAAVSSLLVAPVNSDGSLGTPFTPATPGNTSLSVNGSTYALNWQTKGLAAGSYAILLTLADGTVYAKTVHLTANGSGANAQAADGSDVSSGAMADQLLGGNVALYVDNTNGDLTPDELARIQDAVTAIDAVIAPYGVAVTEVTDPGQADVTLNMDTASPVGGYGGGILGCFDPGTGQITLIAGWSWYTGADATQVGGGQYDFQTTVTHELGHALGLGESSNTASAMYGTLAPGTAIRALTTADLNVPYDDSGPDPQRAAVLPVAVGPAAFGFGRPVSAGPLGPPSLPWAGNDLLFAFMGRNGMPAGSDLAVLDTGKLSPWATSAVGESPATGAHQARAADDSGASRPPDDRSGAARQTAPQGHAPAVDEVFVHWAQDALAAWKADPAGL